MARWVVVGLWVSLGLLAATAAVAVLEDWVGVSNASIVYLVAVVACGVAVGTMGAILASVGSFLVYNFFFVPPLYTFTIGDPDGLLSLFLLLFVGIVVGQLAALQRARAETAAAREREARALFGVSRVLATRASTREALTQIAEVLREEAAFERVWLALGPDPAQEQLVADTSPTARAATPRRQRVLQRMPGDEPARWVVGAPTRRRHPGPGTRGHLPRQDRGERRRPRLDLGRARPGRRRARPDADAAPRAARADQIGQALARDRIAEEAQAAELARRADAVKSSLLQSVSHDFRTPLAVIRAAAGSLDSDSVLSAEDRRANLVAIEREVEYLNRLVANLLDLSRIEAGALRADRDVYDIDDLVTRALDRVRPRLGGRALEVVDRAGRRPGGCRVPGRRARQRARQRPEVHARRGTPPHRPPGWTRAGAVLTVEDDGAGRPRRMPCRSCSRSSTGSLARRAGPGAASASGSPSCAGSSRRRAAR